MKERRLDYSVVKTRPPTLKGEPEDWDTDSPQCHKMAMAFHYVFGFDIERIELVIVRLEYGEMSDHFGLPTHWSGSMNSDHSARNGLTAHLDRGTAYLLAGGEQVGRGRVPD